VHCISLALWDSAFDSIESVKTVQVHFEGSITILYMSNNFHCVLLFHADPGCLILTASTAGAGFQMCSSSNAKLFIVINYSTSHPETSTANIIKLSLSGSLTVEQLKQAVTSAAAAADPKIVEEIQQQEESLSAALLEASASLSIFETLHCI